MRELRVLLVTDFFPPYLGGVEHHVAMLAETLQRRGHTVLVVTLDGPIADSVEDDGDIDVRRLNGVFQRLPIHADPERPWAPPIPEPSLVRELKRVVDEFRPDVIHGHDWLERSILPVAGNIPVVSSLHYYTRSCAKKNLLFMGEACPGPKLDRCVRCVSDHYGPLKGLPVLAATHIGAELERRRSAATIAVSEACATGNGDTVGSHTHVIANSRIDGTAADEVPGLPDEGFILYVGDLRAEKGVPVLIDAMRNIADPPTLVLIGAGDPPPHDGVNAIFLGERPHDQVLGAFSRALFSVVPSLWSEPFGLVALEAFAASKPVVASRTGGLTDFVNHGENGLLVTPGDVAELQQAIERLIEQPELRSQLGANAAQTAAALSPESMVSEIEAVYRSVVG